MGASGSNNELPRLRVSPAARCHILEGDESGGGHRAGLHRSKRHAEIQEELRALISELDISPARLGATLQFIKVNELGLALENIVGIVWQDEIVVSPAIAATISRLVDEMRVDLQALRDRLVQLGLLRR
jgi:hypothetical protein